MTQFIRNGFSKTCTAFVSHSLHRWLRSFLSRIIILILKKQHCRQFQLFSLDKYIDQEIDMFQLYIYIMWQIFLSPEPWDRISISDMRTEYISSPFLPQPMCKGCQWSFYCNINRGVHRNTILTINFQSVIKRALQNIKSLSKRDTKLIFSLKTTNGWRTVSLLL